MPTCSAASARTACSRSLPESTTIGRSTDRPRSMSACADLPRVIERRAVGQALPGAVDAARRKERPIGRAVGPLEEAVGQRRRVRPERVRRSDAQPAARVARHDGRRREHPRRSSASLEGRRHGHLLLARSASRKVAPRAARSTSSGAGRHRSPRWRWKRIQSSTSLRPRRSAKVSGPPRHAGKPSPLT